MVVPVVRVQAVVQNRLVTSASKAARLLAVDLLAAGLVAGALTAASPAALGFQRTLDDAALARALDIARGSDARLGEFHARYVLEGSGPVRSVEIITPFRRAVMLAHRREAGTGPMPTIDELRALVEQQGAGLLVRTIISLDPRHTYVRTPDYSVALVRRTERIQPSVIERHALGPRGTVVPSLAIGGEAAMTGVQIDARFQRISISDPGCCRIVVADPDDETMLVRTVPNNLP